MFVITYGDAFVRHLHGCDLLSQPALLLCVGGALLTAQCIGVLAFARNTVLASKVVCGLRHRIDAITRLHHRIDATPSKCAVLQFLLATKSRFSLRYHKWRAR